MKKFVKFKNIDKRPYQSKYTPMNPAKYKGDAKNIICRSSWEKRFCQYCDRIYYFDPRISLKGSW